MVHEPISPRCAYTDQQARAKLEDLLETNRLPPESVKSIHAFGVLYEHRLATVRVFRDAVLALLDAPCSTRRSMHWAVADLAKRLEERGIREDEVTWGEPKRR